jgi:hypothetical protein
MILNIAYLIVAYLLVATALLGFRYRRVYGFFVAVVLTFGVMNIVLIFLRH